MRRPEADPLSGVVFRLRHGGLSGSIPLGWTADGPGAARDSAAAMTLSCGDSLSIIFRQVLLDSAASAYFGKRGMADLAMLTRTLRDSTAGNARKGIRTFKAGGREFATYELLTNGRNVRVAVFGSAGYYYECEAAPVRSFPAPATYGRLFATHEAVLRSLR